MRKIHEFTQGTKRCKDRNAVNDSALMLPGKNFYLDSSRKTGSSAVWLTQMKLRSHKCRSVSQRMSVDDLDRLAFYLPRHV